MSRIKPRRHMQILSFEIKVAEDKMLKNHENLLFLKNFDAWHSGIARERAVQIRGLCDKFEGLPQKKRLAGYFLIVTVQSCLV